MATLGRMFGSGGGNTFMGLPACADLDAPGARVVILGAGACTSYPSVGAYCAGAPAAIRAAGATYAANLGHMNFDLSLPVLPGEGAAADAGDLAQVDGDGPGNRGRIGDAVRRLRAAGAIPVLIGGDDSVPIPMIAGFEGAPVTILQIDAHIDWREEVESERLGLSSTMRRASEMPHVERIVQVGSRGVGSARPGDFADAQAAGVRFFPARRVMRDGLAPVLEAIPAGARVIVCFDCDALDPSIMPGVIGRTAGGLGYWDVVELVAGVAAKARIVAFDMVEFMPERDVDGLGAMTAAQLLATVIGILARQEG